MNVAIKIRLIDPPVVCARLTEQTEICDKFKTAKFEGFNAGGILSVGR